MLQDFLFQKFDEIWDELKADFVGTQLPNDAHIDDLLEALVDIRMFICVLDGRNPIPPREEVRNYYFTLWASYSLSNNTWADGF